MNIDSDNTQSLLLWLLQEFDPTFSIPSGNGSTSEVNQLEAGTFGVGSDATSSKPVYQLGSEVESADLAHSPSTFSRTVSFNAYLASLKNPRFPVASREVPEQGQLSQTAQSFNFGEIHAVQERFQSLLKQRLLLEYENNPPLFPWESEISEYPAEVGESVGADYASATAVSALDTSPWGTHISSLKVPNLLPQAVLSTLFERCQELARSSSKHGVRLVRAVEALFPAQGDMLEPIAQMVLVPAYRSDSATQAAVTQELVAVAGDYSSAKPEQQIALSMLAAHEILSALTLSLSADKLHDTCDWLTPTGWLKLSATCKQVEDKKQLTVVAVLPEGGEVRLRDGEVEKSVRRSQPGAVDLTWVLDNIDKPSFLEVVLADETSPLNFTVQWTES